MTLLILASWLLLGQAAEPVQIPKFEPPTKTVPAVTEAERAALQAGVTLYSQRKFDEAIAKYQEVLNANPDAIGARYETALAYLGKADLSKAMETLLPILQYQSPDLDKHYALVGTLLDEMKRPKDAIAAYDAAIGVLPHAGTLYYNKAVTQIESLHDSDAGVATLKQGAFADPTHAAIQLMLARVFAANDLRTPEVLALSRFLLVEPPGSREVSGFKQWLSLLTDNLKQDAEGKQHISVNPNKVKTPEGDLAEMDLQIALAQVAAGAVAAGKSNMEFLVEDWTGLLRVWSGYSPKDDADKMLWTYYMPYFKELWNQKLVEPFVYVVCQKVGYQGASAWVTAHPDDVKAFITWDKAYLWPPVR